MTGSMGMSRTLDSLPGLVSVALLLLP